MQSMSPIPPRRQSRRLQKIRIQIDDDQKIQSTPTPQCVSPRRPDDVSTPPADQAPPRAPPPVARKLRVDRPPARDHVCRELSFVNVVVNK